MPYLHPRPPARGGDGGGGGGCAALIIVDCKKPSFRQPDAALRKGGIDVVAAHYPWANRGTTVFVGVPRALRYIFKVTKPFFPRELYERFRFVEHPRELASEGYVARRQLPRSLGGSSGWSLRRYVPKRCLLEGAICKPAPHDLA